MEDLGSPIAAFVRDRSIVKVGSTIEVPELFNAWVTWCREQNRDHPGTLQTFGKDLNAAVPGLRSPGRVQKTVDAATTWASHLTRLGADSGHIAAYPA
jgi:phage/plasmid-associated DNA primase